MVSEAGGKTTVEEARTAIGVGALEGGVIALPEAKVSTGMSPPVSGGEEGLGNKPEQLYDSGTNKKFVGLSLGRPVKKKTGQRRRMGIDRRLCEFLIPLK
ncbi:hypothetical protein Y032_0356g3361 [Ancylostoma ceylanicum]|uniref:Uncharacterized protein n=1 Tax=Ancylostoma ceylanicum TaxID=53326 RepID=A0A016RW45_9BILA|nr:hypothetical protein Y032_0356g3361 [Ancylostoma ceylanicum]